MLPQEGRAGAWGGGRMRGLHSGQLPLQRQAESSQGSGSLLKNTLNPTMSTKGSMLPGRRVLLHHHLSPLTVPLSGFRPTGRSRSPPLPVLFPPPPLALLPLLPSPWVASPPTLMTDTVQLPTGCSWTQDLRIHRPLDILKAQPHPSFFLSCPSCAPAWVVWTHTGAGHV